MGGGGLEGLGRSVLARHLKVARLNCCLIPETHEQIAGAFAIRAFFIAVIPGCLTVRTFGPIQWVDGNCINAVTAQLAADFATTKVCDPDVVTSAATLCTARNRQISLHLVMIRPCRCFPMFQTRRNPDKWPSGSRLIDAVTGEVESSANGFGRYPLTRFTGVDPLLPGPIRILQSASSMDLMQQAFVCLLAY